jgi:hypothetical protein
MPHALHVIHAGEFIRSDPEGTLDMQQSRRVLFELATALVERGVDRAILDVRRARLNPPATYAQLYELARAFRQACFNDRHRLAVLHPLNRVDKAEFLADCMSGDGWNAAAFDNFEEAFDWLTRGDHRDLHQPAPPDA